jgi:hypothetical protein
MNVRNDPTDRLLLVLQTRLSTEFFEVKLEGKIARISRTNVVARCISFRHAAQERGRRHRLACRLMMARSQIDVGKGNRATKIAHKVADLFVARSRLLLHQQSSYPANAGYPVPGGPAQALISLEYWIARFRGR